MGNVKALKKNVQQCYVCIVHQKKKKTEHRLSTIDNSSVTVQ
jgi:hypothetical protein